MDGRNRIWVIALGLLIGFLVVVVRLFYWQVYKAEELVAIGADQYWGSLRLPAVRGEILARDGSRLATSKTAYDLFASLSEVRGRASEIADWLAPIVTEVEYKGQLSLVEATEAGDLRNSLEREVEQELKSKLIKEELAWAVLAKGLANKHKEMVEEKDIEGLIMERRSLRHYPEGSMAAQVLGFVGSGTAGEDEGYFGIEGYYNRELSGRLGQLIQERDASGNTILVGAGQRIESVPGSTLLTSIDRAVQYLVERKLKLGMERYGAKAGTVTVMDPNSGEILAMASFPNYDPAIYKVFPKNLYVNPVVGESFEPGSVLKVIVMALAWDEGVVDEETVCPCEGPVKIGKYTIGTWNNEYYPNSSPVDIIVHSDNVGMVFVAGQLGTMKLVEGLRRFGFGEKTGVDLQDETSPELRDSGDWGEIDRATASFGQGIAVTALQILRGVAVIANGGELITPRVVKEVVADGRDVELENNQRRRIIAQESASMVKEMMVQAVSEGEAKWAAPKGYRIAGKTGTAQIPVAGHYDEDKTIASFVGFAPADDPKFVMLVTLREPESSPWGSETAAPLWFEIAKELVVYWGIGS